MCWLRSGYYWASVRLQESLVAGQRSGSNIYSASLLDVMTFYSAGSRCLPGLCWLLDEQGWPSYDPSQLTLDSGKVGSQHPPIMLPWNPPGLDSTLVVCISWGRQLLLIEPCCSPIICHIGLTVLAGSTVLQQWFRANLFGSGQGYIVKRQILNQDQCKGTSDCLSSKLLCLWRFFSPYVSLCSHNPQPSILPGPLVPMGVLGPPLIPFLSLIKCHVRRPGLDSESAQQDSWSVSPILGLTWGSKSLI